MVKCPKCGKEIDTLKNICTNITHEYTFYIASNGEADYKYERDLSEYSESEYWCPECDAFLFDNEEEAERFLKGEVE